MIEIIEKIEGKGQLRYATVRINGQENKYEVDTVDGLDRYLLYDFVNIDMLYNIDIKSLPINSIFSTGSSYDLPKCFDLIEIANKINFFEVNLVCGINALDWKYPYNINDYFSGLEEFTSVDFGDVSVFMDQISDSNKYYDFSLIFHFYDNVKIVRDGINAATKNFKQCNRKALERLQKSAANVDIVEIKPSIFGVGINVNEIIRKIIQKFR